MLRLNLSKYEFGFSLVSCTIELLPQSDNRRTHGSTNLRYGRVEPFCDKYVAKWVLGHLVPSYFQILSILNFGGMTKSGTKLNSLWSTLSRSSIPLITFSFLLRRLYLYCTLICSDCPDGSFLNFPYLRKLSEFDTADGSFIFSRCRLFL